MSELSKYLVEQILLEDDNSIKKTVVVYVGRFQPFHKGHYATYQHLVKKFGKDNVFIGTSNKIEKPKSPFNFKEKVQIMTTMFGIPSSKIHQVKNPYQPTEILKKFDEKTTAFITVVGEKDSSRLGGKYFTSLKGTPTEGYKDRGYVYAAPSQSNPISGTDVRNGLSLGSDEQKQSFFTDRAYPKFNKTIFNLITSKLNEGIEIPKERIEEWMISEASNVVGNGGSDVDDGPNNFFPNFDVFSKINAKRAAKIGYEIVNMITSKELEDYYEHPTYPNGPTKSVTFFPAGVIGANTPNNQVDIYSSGAYSKWYTHATRKASLVGYSIVSDPNMKDDKKQSGAEARGDKELKQEFENSVNEAITLPVEIGDTLLMGKFKNKKVVVKSIGKDEHGMPTINGKKVVTFRMIKEGFQVIFEDEKEDEKYTHIGYGKFKQKGKEKDTNSPTFQKDDSGKYTELEKDGEPSQQEKPQGQSLTKGNSGDSYQSQLPDNDPAKQEKDWTSGKDGWEILDDSRSKVKKIRKYSDKEYEEETGEYFENDVTKKVAPNAFKDKSDMIQKMKDAKPTFLSSEEMQNMGNTDVGDILSASEDGGKDSMLKLGKERAEEYGKDWDRLEKGIKSNSPVPSPMALRDKNGDLHLLAGNTRLMSFTASGKKLPVKVIDYDGEFQYNESINELVGTEIRCEKCNHQWEIEADDKEKYLCHSCGWDSQQQEYDFAAFDSWQEKMGLNETTDEALSQAQRARKKWALARQASTIKRKRQRTMLRKKPLDKLVKIAYKMAYREVYELFRQRLFSDTPKDELSIVQKELIEKWVQRKKRKVLKKARFKYLPIIRQREADKFKKNEDKIPGGLSQGMTLKDIAKKHNVELSDLLDEFKKGYKVEREHTTDTDIAKEIAMDHLFEDPKYYTKLSKIEELLMGYPDQEWLDNHEKELHKIRKDFDSEVTPKSNKNYQYDIVKENINESKLLMEGGAYGHMNHPFDTEINLTFGDLKDIVNRALEGTLEFTREKTDGQALAVSWVNGRLVAARNKGHLKNRGENALDIKGVADKFAGRGELEKAYNFAMKDMSDSIKSLSSKQREMIFKGGACFMNLEVIYPTSVNVIPYGQPLLVFHGTMEYDESGVAIGENADAGRILAGMIKQINKDVQDNYTIQGPPVISLPKSQELSSKKGKYTSQISKLQKEFGLKDTDGVAEYHQEWWKQWITKNSPSTLDNKTLMGLVKRWAFFDKGFRIDNKNISDEKTLTWAKKTDSQDQSKISKDNLMKFEDIFLGVGADVLQFTSSVLTVNPDEAVRSIKKRIDKTIQDVKKSGDPKKIEKLKLELKRLQAIGGPSKIVPNEGIVFQYKGSTFKLTGAFASVNQLLGIFF
jgi:hypothetical protein